LINLQTVEIAELIFPLRNTGGVGVAGSNPAVPTNLFNDFRCSLEAAKRPGCSRPTVKYWASGKHMPRPTEPYTKALIAAISHFEPQKAIH
jgi:hypothetical protein